MSNTTDSITLPTDSSGCVICTGNVSCPTCADDEYCVMTLLTCTACPTTYCTKKESSISVTNGTTNSTVSSGNDSGTNGKVVGGVVGGVIGGVALIVILVLLFLYKRYWEPRWRENKRKTFAGEEGTETNYDQFDIDYADDDDDDDDDDEDDAGDEEVNKEDAMKSSVHSNNNMNISSQMIPPTLNIKGNRSSTSTTNSKASNLLPIAYIPGVTSAGITKPPALLNNNLNIVGDKRSHITLGSSILGEDDEEEGIVYTEGDEIKMIPKDNNNIMKKDTVDRKTSNNNLTTAIRARPKLVQIVEENEEELDSTDATETPFKKDMHAVKDVNILSDIENKENEEVEKGLSR
ncbi:Opy2p NDAI_0A05050 [Naumovozyma dairenensis CBS 421]|uniref:Membrane anchor Opy2 N-terminal domain-containing protein n=1 Tax=Naumovozyma dairenensis (strain ATCC 10597 / BCRC 20456 / CBS 421 / NBRC 0211 / NRRL Y-12639) TaxID=1071378 RepID=G0W4C2_NAUDC|nr:hypothetical protein NDAI_0A05050 [Naumovozyma dairenensis CBS 421]CCD22660.1 hypothetical protein NDAI_0A05050 [Naumovozyma dairenensis CBS 421]